jgi:Tol biopolymer transport system component
MVITARNRALVITLALLGLMGAALVLSVAARATAPGRDGRIVFRRYLDTGRTTSAIFTVNPDGTREQQVTHPQAGVDDREPDWSPSGAKIAFERKLPCPAGGPKDGLNNTCDLVYTVGRNGKGLTELVPCGFDVSRPFPGTCVGVDDPAWAPDSSRLAFQYNLVDPAYTGSLGVDAGIWTVRQDGTGLQQVTQRTPGTAWDSGPQWSPDGRKLVFVRFDFAQQAEAIFTVNADGTGETQVTPWQLGAGDHPDWSPDGHWILFRVQANDGSSNVYKAHPDGTSITNLTNQSGDGYQYLSSGFSPDGRKIVTARTPGTGPEGAADVVVMNADGSNAHPVMQTRLWESGADWGTAPLLP